MIQSGYKPTRAVIFGSVASGEQHEWSDIDVAIWDARFTGRPSRDLLPMVKLLRPFPDFQMLTFPDGATEEQFPFISEVNSSGFSIDFDFLHQKSEAILAA